MTDMFLFAGLYWRALDGRHGSEPVKDVKSIRAVEYPCNFDLMAIFDCQQRRVNMLIKFQACLVLFGPSYGALKRLKVFHRDQNLFACLQLSLQFNARAHIGCVTQYSINFANTVI